MDQHRYIPLLRPAGFATLPERIRWDYVEAPAIFGLAHRPDLPQSSRPFGVIATDRALTADELARFELRAAP